MAHYAFLDENNIVTMVIVGRDENDVVDGITDWEAYYGTQNNVKCKRTSYNTVNGGHISGGTPFRKNYAGIGYTYDEQRDAFIPPKPYDSWLLDEEKCDWYAPVPKPKDKFATWDEENLAWISIDL